MLIIGGNMACKTSAGQKGAAVKYAGSDFATDKGVVIYFTKDNIICKNPNYKEAAVYNKGYYFLPIETEAINQTKRPTRPMQSGVVIRTSKSIQFS